MSAGAIRAGRAFVELFAEDSKLVRGLKKAQGKLQSWGSNVRNIGLGVAAAGSAALGPLIGATTEFAKTGASFAKIAKQTGNSVESVSRLSNAAKELGIDVDDVVGSMEEMNLRLGEAVQDGTGPLADTFAKLGIDAKEFAALPVTEQYKQLAGILSGIEDRAQRQFIADEIFGGDAFKIMPLLAQGSAGLAEQLGRVSAMSTASAETAAAMTKSWNQVKAALWGATMAIGEALAPAITELANWLAPIIRQTIDWIKENRDLVAWIAKVAAIVVAVGSALAVAGTIISAVGTALGALSAIASVAGTALGVLGSVAAFIVSPIGAVIAAVAALGALALWASGIFDILGETFGVVWDGIKAAVGSGDLAAAGKIAFEGLKVAFYSVWLRIKELWLQLSAFILDKALALVQALSGVLQPIAKLFDFDLQGKLSSLREIIATGSEAKGEQYQDERKAMLDQLKTLVQETKDRATEDKLGSGPKEQADVKQLLKKLNQQTGQPAARVRAEQKVDFVSPGEYSPGNPEAEDPIGQGVGRAQQGADLAGTFSGFALGGLGPDSLQKQQIDQMARANGKLDTINQTISDSQWVFQ